MLTNPATTFATTAPDAEDREKNNSWKLGLPPLDYYEGMEKDYEVRFTPIAVWHRKLGKR